MARPRARDTSSAHRLHRVLAGPVPKSSGGGASRSFHHRASGSITARASHHAVGPRREAEHPRLHLQAGSPKRRSHGGGTPRSRCACPWLRKWGAAALPPPWSDSPRTTGPPGWPMAQAHLTAEGAVHDLPAWGALAQPPAGGARSSALRPPMPQVGSPGIGDVVPGSGAPHAVAPQPPRAPRPPPGQSVAAHGSRPPSVSSQDRPLGGAVRSGPDALQACGPSPPRALQAPGRPVRATGTGLPGQSSR